MRAADFKKLPKNHHKLPRDLNLKQFTYPKQNESWRLTVKKEERDRQKIMDGTDVM